MKEAAMRFFRACLIAIALATPGVAAADFWHGMEAYNAEKYAEALDRLTAAG